MYRNVMFISLLLWLLFDVSARADSQDFQSVHDYFGDENVWGALDNERFGELVGVAWLCGNFSEAHHSVGLADKSSDYLRSTLALAAQGGAGMAQLSIIQKVFGMGEDNMALALASYEWFRNRSTQTYENFIKNLTSELPLARITCFDGDG